MRSRGINKNGFRYLRILLAGMLLSFGSGCVSGISHQAYREERLCGKYEEKLTESRFAEAAAFAEKQASQQDESQALRHLMAGNAWLLAGQWEKSIGQFDSAEDLFQKNQSASLVSKVASDVRGTLQNDTVFPYTGTGQDRVFCCLYKGLAYAAQGRRDAARVEFNRAENHQENWLFERRKEGEMAERNFRQEVENVLGHSQGESSRNALPDGNLLWTDSGFCTEMQKECGVMPEQIRDLASLTPEAYTNVYLNHLVGIFRWLNRDGGRSYLANAAEQMPGHGDVVQDFLQCDRGKFPKNQVWLYIEDGLAPRREEWRFSMPLFLLPGIGYYAWYTGMALPRLQLRNGAAAEYLAGDAPEHLQPVPMLENVDRLLLTEYRVFLHHAVPREVTRAVLRVLIQAACAGAADAVNSDGLRFTLRLSQAAAAVWASYATAADTRGWRSLPKTVRMKRLARPASGILWVSALPGETGGQPELLPISLPEGNSIVRIRKVSGKTRMQVLQIAFP